MIYEQTYEKNCISSGTRDRSKMEETNPTGSDLTSSREAAVKQDERIIIFEGSRWSPASLVISRIVHERSLHDLRAFD